MIKTKKIKMKKIAIITEFLSFTGGIEKVILNLHQELKRRNIKCDIYAGLYEKDKTYNEFKKMRVKYFIKKKLPQIINAFYLRYKFKKLNLNKKGYDGYILFGSHSLAFAKKHPMNVWWSTRPLSYLYGENGKIDDNYLKLIVPNMAIRFAAKQALKILKIWDKRNIKYVYKTFIVGPLAQSWLKKAYPNLDSEVLVSPVDTKKYKYRKSKGYYLNVARHSGDKNVDKIILAFRKNPDKILYQAGRGQDTEYLKALAEGYSNIKLLGFVPEKDLPKLTGGCIASICASENEDYSMNLLESIACGKPTISTNINRKERQAIITDTGILLRKPSVNYLSNAIRLIGLMNLDSMKRQCIAKSKQFSTKRFADRILQEFYPVVRNMGFLKGWNAEVKYI